MQLLPPQPPAPQPLGPQPPAPQPPTPQHSDTDSEGELLASEEENPQSVITDQPSSSGTAVSEVKKGGAYKETSFGGTVRIEMQEAQPSASGYDKVSGLFDEEDIFAESPKSRFRKTRIQFAKPMYIAIGNMLVIIVVRLYLFIPPDNTVK